MGTTQEQSQQTLPKTATQIAYPDQYYAQYDPKAVQPAPVLAWWDMWAQACAVSELPPLSDLLPLSVEFWEGHMSSVWTERAVQGDQIVPYTPPATLPGQQAILASMTVQKKGIGVYYQPAGTSAAVLFPSDDTAYANALQEAQTVQLGAWTDGTQWTLSDGSSVPLTGADVTALFKKLAAYRAACQNHAAALNEALQKDLNADLTAGWPDNH